MYQCENCGEEFEDSWCPECGYDRGMGGTGYPDRDTYEAEKEFEKKGLTKLSIHV